jgi:coproporphyrinogen III oxidase-like Fe-S oxidoreductase
MGVQTFDKGVIAANKRVSTDVAAVRGVCSRFRASGLKDINIDFMAGLHTQRVQHAIKDIQQIDALIGDGLVHTITVYPRSYSYSSIIWPEEKVDPEALLERIRIQLLYQFYFEQYKGWVQFPLYFFSPPSEAPRQPSSCNEDPLVVSKLGFGNSAYSFFDRTNFQNIKDVHSYIHTCERLQGATGSHHTLSLQELTRRHLVFGAKRGSVNLKVNKSWPDRDGREIEKVNLELVENGLAVREADTLRLTSLGILAIEWVVRRYDAILRPE